MDLMEEQLQTLRQLITLKDADLAKMQSNLEAGSVSDADADLAVDSSTLFPTDLDDAVDSVSAEMESVNELDSGIETSSAQSEVEAYFAQIGLDTVENDEDNESLSVISDEELGLDNPVVMESEQDASQQSPVDIAKNAVNTVVVKVKTFYAEYKQESLIAGFVVALFALILLLFKARGRKEKSNAVDTIVSGSAITVGGVTESTDSDNPELEKNITSETDEDIIKAAYASLDDVDTDSEPNDVTASDENELNSDLSSESEVIITEGEVEELKVEVEPEVEALEPITLGDYSSDTLANDEDPQSVVEFNLDTPSDIIEPEVIVTSNDEAMANDDEAESVVEFNLDTSSETSEPEVVVTSNDEDLAVDDLLDFDLESIRDENNDAEVDSDILSLDDDDLNGDGLDFGGSLELDTSEISTLTLDDEPMSLDLNSDLNDDTLDDLNVDVEDDSTLNDDILSLDNDVEETELLDINLDNVTASQEPETEANELEFDLGDFDEIDEAETKLDLAGAYMDMGDPEGARSILEEVLADGDDEQKLRAQALLNDIS